MSWLTQVGGVMLGHLSPMGLGTSEGVLHSMVMLIMHIDIPIWGIYWHTRAECMRRKSGSSTQLEPQPPRTDAAVC